MKKITSILTALSLICTLTACSKGGGSESAQSFTAEKLSDVAYKQEKLPLPENASILYGAVPFDSGNKVYMLGAAEVSPAFWIADRDLGKFERRDLPDFDIGIIYNFGVSNDGEFAVQSFNPFTVRFMRRNLPETPVGQLSDDYSGKKEIPWALRDALTNCRFNLWTRPDFISYNVRKMKDPRPFLTPLHRGGRTVVLGWTVSDERTKARAELHCDNMIFEGIRP